MSNLLLINEIKKDTFQPEMFGGFSDDLNFIRYFYFFDNNINDVFLQINTFLVDNGYTSLEFANKWDDDGIHNELMSAYGNPNCNEQDNANIILVINRSIDIN